MYAYEVVKICKELDLILIKSYSKKFLIISCAVIFVVIGINVWAAIKVIVGPIDATNINRSISIGVPSSESAENSELKWYGALEDALQDDELIKDKYGGVDYKQSDAIELLQIQKDDTLALFYTRTPKEGNVTRVICVLVAIKDGEFSQPYRIEMFGNAPGYFTSSGKTRYTYDCDDSIVFYMEQELLVSPIFGNGQNKMPVCFGMWTDKDEIESLMLAGQKPQIIPVVADEDTRYFWYFEDIEWFGRLTTIDWDNYTYQQIIDLLEITYTKTEP